MKFDKKANYDHLFLGLTRVELARRLQLGQIDPQILRAQLDQNAREVRLEALCERWIDTHSLEQVDKDIPTE